MLYCIWLLGWVRKCIWSTPTYRANKCQALHEGPYEITDVLTNGTVCIHGMGTERVNILDAQLAHFECSFLFYFIPHPLSLLLSFTTISNLNVPFWMYFLSWGQVPCSNTSLQSSNQVVKLTSPPNLVGVIKRHHPNLNQRTYLGYDVRTSNCKIIYWQFHHFEPGNNVTKVISPIMKQ
jgi:hypothetical protein